MYEIEFTTKFRRSFKTSKPLNTNNLKQSNNEKMKENSP